MDQAVPVVKFNGENWTTWKFQVQVVLKSKALYEVVMGTSTRPITNPEEWDRKDAKAQEQLVCRLEEKPLTHILSCNTSAEMWKKLTTIYEHKSQVSVHLLQQKFFSMEYEAGHVAEFVSKIEEIQGNLKQMGEEISDKMAITKILMSLPENLKHFVSAWESTPSDKQTLSELMSRLMIEEERNKQAEQTTALASRSRTGRRPKEMKCFECDKIGHIKKYCPKLKSKDGKKVCHCCKKEGHLIKDCWFNKNKKEEGNKDRKSTAESSSTQALVGISSILNCTDISALIGQSDTDNDWWLDSGATEHMCYNINKFQNLRKPEERRQVKVGNGTILEVQGIGKIEINAWNGKQWVKTDLIDVLLVPELDVNLFSLSTVLDKGFEMHSDKDKCELLDKDGKTRAVAQRQGKLYKMCFKVEESMTSQCHRVESLADWHRKLAHINFDQVKKMLKKSDIKYKEISNPFCKDCLAGKQHRLPFPASDSRSKQTCELIHGDLCGPFEVQSLGEAKYFLMLKDDFSGYRFVYFLKNKSEATRNIESFLRFAETQTGNKIKTLRTDNGLEFINNDLQKLLEAKGIRHERSCAYSPEQNGRAEREMRTLVEATRTMLNSKNMNKIFWAEAINSAVFVLNRAGSSPIKNETPFKLWHDKNFNINIFREFGSKVAVHIPKEKRRKLDVKSEEGILVGYSDTVKGFRIYFPEKNKVEIHRDVIFIPDSEENNKVTKSENIVEQKNIEKVIMLGPEENDEEEEIEVPNLRQDNETSDADTETDIEEENNEQIERNRRQIKKPQWLQDYDLSFFTETEEPTTYDEAINCKNSEKWQEAMKKELKVLRENNTWSEVPWPSCKKVIESKWVFKVKNESEFKARLVARGFQQDNNEDLYDIYAPVAKLATFRILLVISNKIEKPIHQMDVRSAFLYGDIQEEVYMSLPGKNRNNSNSVCKLNKSIYGLKKSPKCWNDKFDSLMKENCFLRSHNDYCLYSKCSEHNKLYVLIYVDDLLILGTDEDEVNNLKITLNKSFYMKDLGIVSQYLGIEIKQNLREGYTELSQANYLKNVLKRFNMQDCKHINTPIDSNLDLGLLKTDDSDLKMQKLCRQIVGSLMYAALGTRPDLCESISLLSRFQDKANENLYKALKRVLRYIKGTLNWILFFKPNDTENILCGFVDSDWGGDTVDRKSTTGYIFKLFNCTISWASKKQQSVSISSTESEYVALSLAISEACWLRKILIDFNFLMSKPVILYEDNRSAICIANNPENNKRLKHIDIKYFFIKEKIETGIVEIVYVKTEDQLADLFTKPLAKIKFEKFRDGLGLQNKC